MTNNNNQKLLRLYSRELLTWQNKTSSLLPRTVISGSQDPLFFLSDRLGLMWDSENYSCRELMGLLTRATSSRW